MTTSVSASFQAHSVGDGRKTFADFPEFPRSSIDPAEPCGPGRKLQAIGNSVFYILLDKQLLIQGKGVPP